MTNGIFTKGAAQCDCCNLLCVCVCVCMCCCCLFPVMDTIDFGLHSANDSPQSSCSLWNSRSNATWGATVPLASDAAARWEKEKKKKTLSAHTPRIVPGWFDFLPIEPRPFAYIAVLKYLWRLFLLKHRRHPSPKECFARLAIKGALLGFGERRERSLLKQALFSWLNEWNQQNTHTHKSTQFHSVFFFFSFTFGGPCHPSSLKTT